MRCKKRTKRRFAATPHPTSLTLGHLPLKGKALELPDKLQFIFLILSHSGFDGNPFRVARKIVLDKRTIAWFNDCNPILYQTKDAEVKLSAHPQRVPYS